MTCWVVSQFKKRTLSFPEPALNTSFLPCSISTSTSSGTIVPSSPFRPLCSELFSTAITHLHIFAVSPISKRHILIIANITMAKMQQFLKIVKLREREGQRVDLGRSLKGHLQMVDGGWWISFPWWFTLNLVATTITTRRLIFTMFMACRVRGR